MEFVKTAAGEDVEVYQAVRRVPRKQEVEETDAKGHKTGKMKAPVLTEDALVPFLPEAITESLSKQVHRAFAARQVLAVAMSESGGITVRVAPLVCSQCGTPLADDHKFCPECGTAVKEA